MCIICLMRVMCIFCPELLQWQRRGHSQAEEHPIQQDQSCSRHSRWGWHGLARPNVRAAPARPSQHFLSSGDAEGEPDEPQEVSRPHVLPGQPAGSKCITKDSQTFRQNTSAIHLCKHAHRTKSAKHLCKCLSLA